MSANRSRVLKRVTELLNLCSSGTYSATLSTRNKTRNVDAIADFVDEAGLHVLTAIAERPNEYRYQFLFDTTVTTSGSQVPAHIGPPARVLITPYSGGAVVEGHQKDYRKVQAYRTNTALVYDATAHDQSGSTLSGYYDIWEDKFYFTGLSAVISLARLPVRADNTTLIPEIMENVWVKLGVGEAGKVGTGAYETGLIGAYAQRGMADLMEFKNGSRTFSEVDVPDVAKSVHVA